MTILIVETYRGPVMHAWGGDPILGGKARTACGPVLPVTEAIEVHVKPDTAAWERAKAEHRDCHVCLRCNRIVTAARPPRGENER